MKAKLKIEKYEPRTEYCDGRIFFGKKGTIQTVWISGYLDPVIELIKKMEVKHIVWKVIGYTMPEKLIPFVKEKGLIEMQRLCEQNIQENAQ